MANDNLQRRWILKMKNFKLFVLMLCMGLCVILFSACSAGIPNAEKIMADLNATKFINAAELYANDETKTIPVTNVSITDTERNSDNCEITCTTTQEDEHYKKESQLIISYEKLDNWVMAEYNAINVAIAPISGVPDDIIKDSYLVTLYDEYPTVICSDISHDFNLDSLTDDISIELVLRSDTCERDVSTSLSYKFNNIWIREKKEEKTVSRKWLLDNLVGTTWSGSLGFGGVRTVRINGVDTTNQTIDLDYGYSSLTESEVCSYQIKDYNQFGEKQALVISLTYDFYDLEILEDGIWYGARLNKNTE